MSTSRANHEAGTSRANHEAGTSRANHEAAASPNVTWHHGHLSRDERWAASGLRGATVWLTGLSGSGKSTVAAAAEKLLIEEGRPAYVLDGDNVRHGLNGDLGYSAADRDENVRRVSEVARLFADAGVIALVPLISPYRHGRDRARDAHAAAGLPFLEVFVDTPIELCEQRDPKGLYAKARAGEITGFTGIDDPYEAPLDPELVLRPDAGDPAVMAGLVIDLLRVRAITPPDNPGLSVPPRGSGGKGPERDSFHDDLMTTPAAPG